MRGLGGKRVIVTGGASGIGREICKRFGEEGSEVGIFDLNEAGAQETADIIVNAGGKASAHGVDITDRASVDTAVSAFAAGGPIDVLVNNAGWDKPIAFLDTDIDFWKKIVDLNLYGPLHMHHAVLPIMVEQKSGRVVNIASDAGRVGSSGEAVYSACKGGIVAFSKTLAREHARHGITVNVVCPGPTESALFADFKQGAGDPEKLEQAFRRSIPLGRIGQPDDLPGAVLFFASDDAAYVTGQVLSVSGGLTMAG